MLIHVEVQGYKEEDFPKRMFTYFYRILDSYQKPVTAFVIFTDTNKNFSPSKYEYHFLGTSLVYNYNVYKVILQDEQDLFNNNNPFAIVIATVLLALKKRNINDEQLLGMKLALVKNLLQKQISKPKIKKLLYFLQHYVSFADPAINIKFGANINILSDKNKTMDIEEMIVERSKKEGKKEVAVNMMKEGLSLETIQRITNLQMDELMKLSKKIKKGK